jgi:desulfoferrodoxin-like iron-binding protein
LREIDQSLRIEGGDKLANEVGKRYLCEKCNAEFIVTRAGEGKLACCGQPMTLKK